METHLASASEIESRLRYFSEKRGTREMTLLISQMTQKFFEQPVDAKLKSLWLLMLQYDDTLWSEWFSKKVCFADFKAHFFASALYQQGAC